MKPGRAEDHQTPIRVWPARSLDFSLLFMCDLSFLCNNALHHSCFHQILPLHYEDVVLNGSFCIHTLDVKERDMSWIIELVIITNGLVAFQVGTAYKACKI